LLDRVIFASPSADVLSFYAAADVLISPSIEDSFNLPCLEVMAREPPVILSPHAGISEWIRSGTDAVLMSDPQDSHELAGAIRALVSDPERMRQLGENAVRTAATLTWDQHARIIHEFLCSRLTSQPS
jgi:glycosyltransferase involved in cell wall biosynthesis